MALSPCVVLVLLASARSLAANLTEVETEVRGDSMSTVVSWKMLAFLGFDGGVSSCGTGMAYAAQSGTTAAWARLRRTLSSLERSGAKCAFLYHRMTQKRKEGWTCLCDGARPLASRAMDIGHFLTKPSTTCILDHGENVGLLIKGASLSYLHQLDTVVAFKTQWSVLWQREHDLKNSDISWNHIFQISCATHDCTVI